MTEKKQGVDNRRKYIRLPSICPVQFRLVTSEAETPMSGWLQGFTSNISYGGISLDVNYLSPDVVRQLKEEDARLAIEVEMSGSKQPVQAISSVSWMQATDETRHHYTIGLRFEHIDPAASQRLVRYARAQRIFLPVVWTVIAFLALGFVANTIINLKLMASGKELVEQLVTLVQTTEITKQKMRLISKEKQDLDIQMQSLQERLKTLTDEQKAKAVVRVDELQKVNAMIVNLSQQKETLEARAAKVASKEHAATQELLQLDEKKAKLEKANLESMYHWLTLRQSPRTGLLVSFEGDHNMEYWAFTYDQALALQAFINFADYDRARKLLEFYDTKAKRTDGLFLNAYYVKDGSAIEYTLHTGPNVWLGIAALQYAYKAHDRAFVPLAESIAAAVMRLQAQDPEGGIRGGPSTAWYSTEHNLDAYAFFVMLRTLTGKQEYSVAAEKTLKWIVAHTYDKSDTPIRRGMGDSTIATDTYAWSVAAIGPEQLLRVDMNPDRIMEFAEENCCVEASFTRPDGSVVKVKGFDFAAQRHIARGGVVSTEWTAQMIMAFKILSDYYYSKNMPAKGQLYARKADAYLTELEQLIITSPSASGQGGSCLPYATQDAVDTGHGWMTPQGKCTGSVAGTVYTLFAYYNYNPLMLKD